MAIAHSILSFIDSASSSSRFGSNPSIAYSSSKRAASMSIPFSASSFCAARSAMARSSSRQLR